MAKGKVLRPEQVTALLATAATIGDEAAAKQFGVTRFTVIRWRKRAKVATGLSPGEIEKKEAENWLAVSARVRDTLIRRVETLAQASDDLRQVAGALKIVVDAMHTDRMVEAELDEENGQSHQGVGAKKQAATPEEGTRGALLRLQQCG